MKHFLTVDLEDWYHAHYPKFNYKEFEPTTFRVEKATDKLLQLFDDVGVKATFFTLGTIGNKYPKLIKKISRQGHRIACHGWNHDLIGELTNEQLYESISKAKKLLEDLIGDKIIGFRAPNFSVIPRTWKSFIETLEECNFIYDSSAYAGKLYYGGMPNIIPYPHKIPEHNLYEFPPSIGKLLGMKFPLGGFYIRALKTNTIINNIKKIDNLGYQGVIYIHPKDIDDKNPPLPVGTISSWIHSTGTNNCFKKLSIILTSSHYQPIEDSEILAKLYYEQKEKT